MSRHKAISDFSEFITEGTIAQEGKFFDEVGTYVYTDFKKRGDEEKVQRYKNVKTGVALNLLEIVWKSGKEGVRYSDLSRAYFEMSADEEGKRERLGEYDRERRDWKRETRGWNPTEDRGYGASFLVKDSWSGQTGILVAHCKKNTRGRWVLTDPILNRLFANKYAKETDMDQDDIDMFDELGILGDTIQQYRVDQGEARKEAPIDFKFDCSGKFYSGQVGVCVKKEGTGRKPSSTSKVKVYFIYRDKEGKDLDIASYSGSGNTPTFKLDELTNQPALQQGIAMMREGSIYMFRIPAKFTGQWAAPWVDHMNHIPIMIEAELIEVLDK